MRLSGNDNNSEHKPKSIQRYNEMLFKQKAYYFDVHEFEEIVDYFIDKQDWIKALEAIKYSKKLHPFIPALLLKEADLLGATGQSNAALELIARVELIEHKNPELFLMKGALLSELELSDKAIDAYLKAVNLSCDDLDEVYLSIAFEFQNQSNYEKAIEFLIKSLQLNPKNEDALYEIGYCYTQLNQQNGMLDFLNTFLDEHPYCDHAWNNLGSIYLQQGNYDKAIDAFDFALAINDDFVTATFNKGSALIACNRFEEAIEVYETCTKTEVAGSLAFHQIGYCHEQLGNFNKAMVLYNKSIQLDEDFSESWISLAKLHSSRDKHVEAIYAIKKALQNEEDNADYWSIFGQIQGKAGLIEEAKFAYDKATVINPYSIPSWLDYAELLFQNHFFDEAVEVLNNGISHNPTSAEFYYRLGAYFTKVGYESDAEDIIHLALDMNFDKHEELLDYLAHDKYKEFIFDLIESHKEA